MNNVTQPTITIYRLENEDGYGPFSGNQEATTFLTKHNNPEDMLKEVKLSKRKFKNMMTNNYIFGWKNEDLYKKFFKQKNKTNGEKECQKLGFKLKKYTSNEYVIFPDGQVIFKTN